MNPRFHCRINNPPIHCFRAHLIPRFYQRFFTFITFLSPSPLHQFLFTNRCGLFSLSLLPVQQKLI